MTDNKEIQNWRLDVGKGKRQKRPGGPLHTLLLIVWICLSIALIGLGLFLIIDSNQRLENIGLALVTILIAVGVIYIFAIATRTTKLPIKTALFGLLLILGGILLQLCSVFLTDAYRLGTGTLGLFIAIFMFVDVWREKVDGAPWIGSLIWGIIYFVLSLFILINPSGERVLSIITGIYLIMLGGNVFFEALGAIFYSKPHTRRVFTVALPMFIAACLPMAFFREINTYVKEDPDEVLYLEGPDPGTEPDLTVYIHTRAGFIPGFGHCDLCYDGEVYSYGDYDEATWKMGGFIADGVMAKIPPEKHIEMALEVDKKILMAYGLRLTPELKEDVENKLKEIMSKAHQWKPKAQLAAEGEIEGDPKSFKDVGSNMYNDEDAELFKFDEGSKYKTYYALKENCSEVVNDVVGKTGLNLLNLNGIVTPGTYLEYLDELYTTADTIVVDRRLYMLNEDGKPCLYPLNKNEPIRLGDMSN